MERARETGCGTPLSYGFLCHHPEFRIPHHRRLRFSAARSNYTSPMASPDARRSRALALELRTPTLAYACTPKAYTPPTTTHRIRSRLYVRASRPGYHQTMRRTHAHPRTTRRTEARSSGFVRGLFGPVRARFRLYKPPTCTYTPQQSTPVLTHRFCVSPSPVRVSRVQRECALPVPVPETTKHHQQPAAQPLPFPSPSSTPPSRTV
jgi:hypothetical protein